MMTKTCLEVKTGEDLKSRYDAAVMTHWQVH